MPAHGILEIIIPEGLQNCPRAEYRPFEDRIQKPKFEERGLPFIDIFQSTRKCKKPTLCESVFLLDLGILVLGLVNFVIVT